MYPVRVPVLDPVRLPGTTDTEVPNATGQIPGSIPRTKMRPRTSPCHNISVTIVTRQRRQWAKRLPVASRCVTCQRQSAKKIVVRRATRHRRRRRRTMSPKSPDKLRSVSPFSGSDESTWTDSYLKIFVFWLFRKINSNLRSCIDYIMFRIH